MGLMKQIQIEIDNSEALKYLFHLVNETREKINTLQEQLQEVINT